MSVQKNFLTSEVISYTPPKLYTGKKVMTGISDSKRSILGRSATAKKNQVKSHRKDFRAAQVCRRPDYPST